MEVKIKKKKQKKEKTELLKTKENADEYPTDCNPFEATETKPENGKIKIKSKSKDKKKKTKNKENNSEEGNPFLEQSEKKLKKMEKKEKKMMKKEQKKVKKEAKKAIKNQTDSNNTDLKRNDVGEREKLPENGELSSTNDSFLKSSDQYSSPSPSSNSPEKLVPTIVSQEVTKTEIQDTNPTIQHLSRSERETRDEDRIVSKQPLSNEKAVGNVTDSLRKPTSQSTALNGNQSKLSSANSQPVQDKNEQLVPVDKVASNDIKMYRKASISKRGKEKKKLKKKLAKRLKKKKKGKYWEGPAIIEDQELTNQVIMRKPRENIEELQREVEEVTNIVRNSIISLAEKRNSALDELTKSTKELEEFSLGFARTAQENRLKQQARVTCCGLGVKYKVCWYICACEGRLKRKKKKKDKNTKEQPESSELLKQTEDDDDYYKPAQMAAQDNKSSGTSGRSTPSTTGLSSTSGTHAARVHPSPKGSRGGANQISLRHKLLLMPSNLRGSMSRLDELPSSSTLRSMAEQDPRERKSSSVNALHEIVKKRGEKKRKIKQEKDIAKFASQYDDEETRRKVEELLRLDM